MPEPPCILLLERDAPTASHLVVHLQEVGADVITADHAVQALERLAQLSFAGAVIDYWSGATDRTSVAQRLIQLDVPFIVHALVEPPPGWRAARVADPNKIVAAVMKLLQRPENS